MKRSKKEQLFFSCKPCDYNTSKQYNMDRHKMTLKHKMLTNANEKEQKGATFPDFHVCSVCKKHYKHKSSLCRHQQHCNNSVMIEDVENNSNIVENNESVTIDKEKLELMENNLKLKDEMIEKQNKIIELSQNNNTTINNNLNINVYLNEHCKDAMNLTEFVNKINLSIEDLFYTKNNGFINGMSNIFIKHLEELEPTNRPIQSSDKKGTQMYIKDDDKWEKDHNEKFETEINHVTKKHILVLKEWEEKHPNWKDSDKETQTYMELVQKITGGSSDDERKRKIKQIKKNIGKNTIIKDIIIL